MRQASTFPDAVPRPVDLIDAATAVNDAPTLPEAFRLLAEAALTLLGADRVSAIVWNDELGEGTVVAAAGASVTALGLTLPPHGLLRHALETGEPSAWAPELEALPPEIADALQAIATVVVVPVRTTGYRASFHAGFGAALDDEERARAIRTLRTLVRLTSVAERSLRERQRHQLASVLEGIADGVVVWADGEVTANAAARAILAVPPGGEITTALLSPRTLAGDEHPLPGEAGRFRIRVTALDGRELVLDGTVSPLEPGAVVVFRDVTDEHARAVLNERYLYALFNAMPIPLTVGGAGDRRVIDVNRAFLDLTGFERDEVVGATPPYPWWDPAEGTGGGLDPGSTLTQIYRCKDGRPLVVEVASHGVPGHDGGIELLLGVVTDLSEKQRLDQQLVQSGKLAAIGELAAGVAHEINNPLFAILGLTEFLLKESDDGSRARQRLELIQQTGLEIKEIVRALLDFARENAEEREVVPLEDVVRSTVDLVRRTNAHKGVELVDSYHAPAAHVLGSPNQLKQVVLNLIANARQAMPLGGTVRVEVHGAGDHAVVTVADDGPGIEPAVLARIFEPFFTTKRSSGGTGLGLSVSLGIAESHGGSLTASSQPGAGAAFTLRLPLVEEVR